MSKKKKVYDIQITNNEDTITRVCEKCVFIGSHNKKHDVYCCDNTTLIIYSGYEIYQRTYIKIKDINMYIENEGTVSGYTRHMIKTNMHIIKNYIDIINKDA